MLKPDSPTSSKQPYSVRKGAIGSLLTAFLNLKPAYADHYRKVFGRKAWHIGLVSSCNKATDKEKKESRSPLVNKNLKVSTDKLKVSHKLKGFMLVNTWKSCFKNKKGKRKSERCGIAKELEAR